MFKNILSDIKEWFSSLNGKKIFIIVLTGILIVSPLLFALGNIIYHNKLQDNNVFTIVIYDSDDNEIGRDSGSPEKADEDTLTRTFYEIISYSSVLPELPSHLNMEKFIRASITYNGESQEIKCYFSPDQIDGYYVDAANTVFSIPKELCESFLLSSYSEVFYNNSKIYSLSSADHDNIIPTAVSWNYKNISNSYVQATKNTVANEQKTYEITSTIDIAFENQPNSHSIRIYDEGTLIYQGKNTDFTSVTASSGNDLRIIIDAEWYKSKNSERYGTLRYDFFVHIKNRSTFSVSNDKISLGEFLTLECTNITDLSKIDFTSNIKGLSPKFNLYNDKVIALIPFYKMPEQGENFEFTVTYGASMESFIIEIAPHSAYSEYTLASDIFGSNESQIKNKNESIKKTLESNKIPLSNSVYFRGNFSSPINNGLIADILHNSTVKWGKQLQYSFVALGNRYTAPNDQNRDMLVRAVQNGVVTSIGTNDIFGNYVVLDHGCGLRTWYTNLSSVDVEIGDILLTDESIGKTGLSNIDNKYGFTLYCTTYNTIIDPNFLFEE